MSPTVLTLRWFEPVLPAGVAVLAEAARREGYNHLTRFQMEWEMGVRFDGPGECLFVARDDAALVGIAGMSSDPYLSDPSVGRLRHVYVAQGHRRAGIATQLVKECLCHGGGALRAHPA